MFVLVMNPNDEGWGRWNRGRGSLRLNVSSWEAGPQAPP